MGQIKKMTEKKENKENIYIYFKKLTPDAIIPTKGSELSVGHDLYRYDNSNNFIFF